MIEGGMNLLVITQSGTFKPNMDFICCFFEVAVLAAILDPN